MTLFRGIAAALALVSVVALGAVSTATAQGMSGRGEARINVEQLKKLYDAGSVVVVDVRPVTAYRDGHIAGALSVPLDTVPQKAAELKAAGKVVVTYCT